MINQVILMGRIGTDAEVKSFESGSKVTSFTLATTSGYGEKAKTFWHDIQIWGEYGEKLSKYLVKGKEVCVTGEIEYRTVDTEGGKRKYTTINVNKVALCGSKSDSSGEPAKGVQVGQPEIGTNSAQKEAFSSSPVDPTDDLPF